MTVVVDNMESDVLPGEWGLCIYIEYKDRKILLDTGGSNLFVDNAEKIGISLPQIDFAVLSHAHYDHSNGLPAFFRINSKAKSYLSEGCKKDCYIRKGLFRRYNGLPKDIRRNFPGRIVYVSKIISLCDGVALVPHSTPGLDRIGKTEHMFLKEGRHWQPDDFSHEQSLVFDTAKGLIVFNSCSHGGVDTIVQEVQAAFPEKNVYAFVGGFHTFNKPAEYVRSLARQIKHLGMEQVYTGHCTGQQAFQIMKEELGESLRQIKVGFTAEL